MNVRLDIFAKESGDPALPPLSDALARAAESTMSPHSKRTQVRVALRAKAAAG
jgi:hypothetical protein